MNKINLAILWHMHQPPYLDPFTQANLLPWAFLHGMKDYYDMGAVAARHPRMRMNFNFTPSLLEQLAGYSAGTITDRTLGVMSRPPDEMSDADREYLFRTCFGQNDLMVARFPGFVRLRHLYRAAVATGRAVPLLKPHEITDLTVLYLLSWCGPTLAGSEIATTLRKKARGFTDDDREALLAEARRLITATGPLFRGLVYQGIVELSTTPATHPILPLLCTSLAAIEARHDVTLPPTRFEYPDEARRQIETGLRGFESFFGFRPAGMWPAEGSVSKQAVSMLGRAGIRWVATDEEILRRSGRSRASDFRHPWSWDGVSIFFRDHFLSDQIGFVYSKRRADKAVADFIHEMSARATASKSESDLVVVALDGENAWEYYPDGGFPFLDSLYAAIEDSGFITPVTFGEYIDRYGPGEPLDNLATGSWIDGNFDTWIGDPVKNRAWDYLAAAKQATDGADLTPEAREKVDRHLLRAEASDWFWWFGHGHSSIHEKEFDFLFRRNLKAVYDDAGICAPDYLDRPLGLDESVVPMVVPTACISPRITGRRDSYYKWVGAGSCTYSHGSIHRLSPVISRVQFGFDRENFYVGVHRFDGATRFLAPGTEVRLVFRRPRDVVISIKRTESGTLQAEGADTRGNPIDIGNTVAAAFDLLEVAIPLAVLRGHDAAPRINVSFHVETATGDVDEERFPWDSSIDFGWNPQSFELNGWFV